MFSVVFVYSSHTVHTMHTLTEGEVAPPTPLHAKRYSRIQINQSTSSPCVPISIAASSDTNPHGQDYICGKVSAQLCRIQLVFKYKLATLFWWFIPVDGHWTGNEKPSSHIGNFINKI